MSTRSYIGMKLDDGTVVGVYCHSDGYLSHNGKILLENYNTKEKVDELLKQGNISFLDKEIGDKHGFDCNDRPEGVSTFYGRDRGESDQGAQTFISEIEFLMECTENYTYLFKDGKWYWRMWNNKELHELTAEHIANDKG